MDEYCIVNDEGIIEEGFWTIADAQLAAAVYPVDENAKVERRDLYDEDGEWIDEYCEDDDDDGS